MVYIPVLNKIQIFGYIDSIPTSINDNVLKRYFQGKKREQIITSSELNYWITERFCVDKEIYERAIEIFNKNLQTVKALLTRLSNAFTLIYFNLNLLSDKQLLHILLDVPFVP